MKRNYDGSKISTCAITSDQLINNFNKPSMKQSTIIYQGKTNNKSI